MSADESNEPRSGAPDAAAGRFAIQKIYLKDASFESPNAPAAFNGEWKPNVELNLANNANRIGAELYEVVVTVTATVSVGGKTAFLVEVHQAGIFSIGGVEDDRLGPLLGSFCPGILFPYAREAVSDLVTRGGFPQFLLSPVNFDVLYRQHLESQAAEGSREASRPAS